MNEEHIANDTGIKVDALPPTAGELKTWDLSRRRILHRSDSPPDVSPGPYAANADAGDHPLRFAFHDFDSERNPRELAHPCGVVGGLKQLWQVEPEHAAVVKPCYPGGRHYSNGRHDSRNNSNNNPGFRTEHQRPPVYSGGGEAAVCGGRLPHADILT